MVADAQFDITAVAELDALLGQPAQASLSSRTLEVIVPSRRD